MHISQKCQYALRAVFELAGHYDEEPVKIAEIAENQAIPVRFLEQILTQLRQGGFVESRRGSAGGYLLARPPSALRVGDIVRFVEGPLAPVKCTNERTDCPLSAQCVFLPMWEKARQAVASVYDATSFRDLLDEEARMRGVMVLDYSI